jgi:hypothetical protein
VGAGADGREKGSCERVGLDGWRVSVEWGTMAGCSHLGHRILIICLHSLEKKDTGR